MQSAPIAFLRDLGVLAVEAERVEAERLEVERIEAEQLEAEQLEAERLEVTRLEAEKREIERLEAVKVEVNTDITATVFVAAAGSAHIVGKDKRKFREIRLSKKAKNIFASQKKGPVFYLSLLGLIALLIVVWIGFSNGLIMDRSLSEQVLVDASESVAMTQTPQLVDDIKPTVTSGEAVTRGAIGSVAEEAEVTRIVNIETPEFSITVDRPHLTGSPAKESGLVLDLSVKGSASNLLDGMQSGKVSTTRYEVHKGDTLWAIAKNILENPFLYPELAENNGIKNPDLIYPGDVVTVTHRTTP